MNATPPFYRIRIQGKVHERWQSWFEPLTLFPCEDGNSVLEGPIQDQSQLVGIINQIHNLNLCLISVEVESHPDKENHLKEEDHS